MKKSSQHAFPLGELIHSLENSLSDPEIRDFRKKTLRSLPTRHPQEVAWRLMAWSILDTRWGLFSHFRDGLPLAVCGAMAAYFKRRASGQAAFEADPLGLEKALDLLLDDDSLWTQPKVDQARALQAMLRLWQAREGDRQALMEAERLARESWGHDEAYGRARAQAFLSALESA